MQTTTKTAPEGSSAKAGSASKRAATESSAAVETTSTVKPTTAEPATPVKSSAPVEPASSAVKSPTTAVKSPSSTMSPTLGESRLRSNKEKQSEACEKSYRKGLLHFRLRMRRRRTAGKSDFVSDIQIRGPTTAFYTQVLVEASACERTPNSAAISTGTWPLAL